MSSIESITIPRKVTRIGKRAFCDCKILKLIEFAEDSKLQKIEEGVFHRSLIESIKIPREITQICRDAFFDSFKLRLIEFAEDSKLQTIEENAFSWSHIESITIPREVTKICSCAFCNCKQLQRVEFENESKLQTIEGSTFSGSSIESFAFPPRLVELKQGWCKDTPNLNNIIVSPDDPRYLCVDGRMVLGKTSIKKSMYDSNVFCARNIESIKIPDCIERICSFSLINATNCNESNFLLNQNCIQSENKHSLIHRSRASRFHAKSL